MTRTAYIGFGSNLGDSMALLRSAAQAIAALNGVELRRVSPMYQSAPLDVDDVQPDYINAVIETKVSIPADVLLDNLLTIENRLGRIRSGTHKAARPIDLDLLLFGEMICQTSALILPHPRMHQRAFVLQPLHDLVPDLKIPGAGLLSELLEKMRNQQIRQVEGDKEIV